MAFELPGLLKVSLGTVRKPKFEVYDIGGSTAFEIDSGTFTLKNVDDGTIALSGNITARNDDTDAAGNSVKTIQATMDFTDTDIETGHYQLVMKIDLTNGESEMFRIAVEIVDFREVT